MLNCNQNLKGDPKCKEESVLFSAGMGEQSEVRWEENMQLWPTSGGRKNKVVDSATPSSLLPSRRINI